MKKLALVLVVAAAFIFVNSMAFAGVIAPGKTTKCNNAKSITLTVKGTSSKGDRTNANLSIWKSSNATTVPISLGPGGDHGIPGGAFGNKKDNLGKKGWMVSAANMPNKHSKGKSSVTLTSQNNFSRGDSIGDISGEVRITNTGTIPVDVKC